MVFKSKHSIGTGNSLFLLYGNLRGIRNAVTSVRVTLVHQGDSGRCNGSASHLYDDDVPFLFLQVRNLNTLDADVAVSPFLDLLLKTLHLFVDL